MKNITCQKISHNEELKILERTNSESFPSHIAQQVVYHHGYMYDNYHNLNHIQFNERQTFPNCCNFNQNLFSQQKSTELSNTMNQLTQIPPRNDNSLESNQSSNLEANYDLYTHLDYNNQMSIERPANAFITNSPSNSFLTLMNSCEQNVLLSNQKSCLQTNDISQVSHSEQSYSNEVNSHSNEEPCSTHQKLPFDQIPPEYNLNNTSYEHDQTQKKRKYSLRINSSNLGNIVLQQNNSFLKLVAECYRDNFLNSDESVLSNKKLISILVEEISKCVSGVMNEDQNPDAEIETRIPLKFRDTHNLCPFCRMHQLSEKHDTEHKIFERFTSSLSKSNNIIKGIIMDIFYDMEFMYASYHFSAYESYIQDINTQRKKLNQIIDYIQTKKNKFKPKNKLELMHYEYHYFLEKNSIMKQVFLPEFHSLLFLFFKTTITSRFFVNNSHFFLFIFAFKSLNKFLNLATEAFVKEYEQDLDKFKSVYAKIIPIISFILRISYIELILPQLNYKNGVFLRYHYLVLKVIHNELLLLEKPDLKTDLEIYRKCIFFIIACKKHISSNSFRKWLTKDIAVIIADQGKFICSFINFLLTLNYHEHKLSPKNFNTNISQIFSS